MSGFNLSYATNVIVRALIPLFGVAFLGWFGTKLLAVYFADTLASFYSAAMLVFYAVVTTSAEYQTRMKNGATVGGRLRTGIKVALSPLPFVLVVGFFFGILPLFVMLDLQAVSWHEFLADRDLYIAAGCQFAGAITLLMNELDWVRTLDDPQHWFQRQVALLGARWGAMVLFGFFLSPIIPGLIYGPLLIVTYAVATVALELAPARVLDLLARLTGRANIGVTKSAAHSAGARHATPARPAAPSVGGPEKSSRREDQQMAGNPDTQTKSTRHPASWFVLIAGAAIAVVGAIGVWAEMDVTFRSISTTARVIEHHHAAGSSRMASIVAQVEVAVPNGRAFRTEVEDQFAVADWVDGGTVNVICAKLATDYPHCELDSILDRWLTPVIFLVIGLGAVWGWGWWRLRRT